LLSFEIVVPTTDQAMAQLAISIPESLFASLRKAPNELAREMGIAAAIHWYQQGCISMERAAEAAGMDRPRFLQELARRKVDVFVLDAEELTREFGNL
jgi:predicted HTH domain antitoxin